MLSIDELNKHNEREIFLSILKEKLPTKRYKKIIQKSDYNRKIFELQIDLVNLQNWISKMFYSEDNKQYSVLNRRTFLLYLL